MATMYRAKDHTEIKVTFFTTTQDQLDYLRFPLGEIEKRKLEKLPQAKSQCCK